MFTGTRFRWGISALGGPFVGGYSGGVGGINTRFGAQISRQLGVYGQPVLLAGAGAVVANGVAASATGLALWGVGVLPEMTFGDFFYLGLGPEVLIGGLASATAGGGGSADAGAFFSLAGRAGFALGSYKPERRSAFTIGLDFHMIFASDVVVTPLIALGYDAY